MILTIHRSYLAAVIFFTIFLFLFISSVSYAKVGVGMGAGEIRIQESIKLGGMYELPSVRIFNTGDEVTTYTMNIAYHQDRHELRPQKDWFSFSPKEFTLEPNQSQEVRVSMSVPLREKPGSYFAFIESGPISKNEVGTSVGIAVATKLFFTIIPANVFQAIVFRATSFFEIYSPWSWLGLVTIILIFVLIILRRFISLNISFRR